MPARCRRAARRDPDHGIDGQPGAERDRAVAHRHQYRGATSDRINVSGGNLAGAVQLQVQNLALWVRQQTVLSAAGGTANNGLTLLASPRCRRSWCFPMHRRRRPGSGIQFRGAWPWRQPNALGNALNRALQTAGLGAPVFNLLLNRHSCGL